MKDHFELSDQEFEKQLETGTLNPKIFNHEAHIRLAWIHIHKYGVNQAINNITHQLKRYVASLGASEKYNETVTIAAIKAVNHFMVRSTTQDFLHFISENHRLKNNFKELLNSHYHINIFESNDAKKNFLEPELLPFD